MTRALLTVAVAATMLAGCGDAGGADRDNDGEITAEEMAREAASGGDIAMRAGKWEHKVEFTELDIPGVPENMREMVQSRMAQGVTTEQCLTEEEANRPSPEFFGNEGQSDCKYDEFDRSGDRMTLRMTCKAREGGTVNVAMDGQFGEEAFTFHFDNRIVGTPAGQITVKGKVSGTRIGEC